MYIKKSRCANLAIRTPYCSPIFNTLKTNYFMKNDQTYINV